MAACFVFTLAVIPAAVLRLAVFYLPGDRRETAAPGCESFQNAVADTKGHALAHLVAVNVLVMTLSLFLPVRTCPRSSAKTNGAHRPDAVQGHRERRRRQRILGLGLLTLLVAVASQLSISLRPPPSASGLKNP